jgi:hypothetical protein
MQKTCKSIKILIICKMYDMIELKIRFDFGMNNLYWDLYKYLSVLLIWED